MSFLKYHLKLSVEHMCDPFHASWNATKEAVADAGLLGTLHAGVMTITNLAYGPFQKSAWFRHLQTAAHDISGLSPNDPLLNFLWPKICQDQGFTQMCEEWRVAGNDLESCL